MSNRKLLVLDTSVLLYDKSAIHSFPGNDVIIPLPVLDELDRFKDKSGLLGESARYVNRYLDGLREIGRLDKEVQLPNSDQTIRIETSYSKPEDIPAGLLPDYADNQIVATALGLARIHPQRTVKLVTKDINLRVKCDALGLVGEDYWKDHIPSTDSEGPEEPSILSLDDSDVDKFYEDGYIDLTRLDHELYPNQFVIAKSYSGKSLIGIFKKNQIHKIGKTELGSTVNIEPRGKEQAYAMNILCDATIQLVSLTGIAGSGKTYLALMCGLAGLMTRKYKRIIVTRSIQPVGRDLGYLPGDMGEKMAPWMAPIMDNFRHAFKDLTYFDMMKQKGEIEIAPLAYIRGRTFNDSYVIVDEAQNATIHELKTIITRIGHGSKIVLMGDTDQVDTPYIDKKSNGLSIAIEKLKNTELAAHAHLKDSQRSAIAAMASNIL
mgnify:CR=1 FL=1|tara:strand:- start:17780 stop:19084 length:1305 start_codon:yes stop_codon:yes gene_type:complete